VCDTALQLIGVPVKVTGTALVSHHPERLPISKGGADVDCPMIEDVVVVAGALY
jgi:hypothetical protein